MRKYIDADELKKVFRDTEDAEYARWTLAGVIGEIDNIEAADVEEVVRCKDCKWFGDIGCAIRIVDDSDRPSENDFCSFAERKDNG